MLTAGSISLSDSLVDFQSDRIRRGDLGEYSDDSRRFPAPVPRHQTQVRTAAALHDRFRYAADQPAGSEYVPFRTVRRRTYPLGSFIQDAGLLDYLYLGVKLGIYPCLIFIGVGAMTDFGPLIANPKSFMLGAAAQLGIFVTFLGAYALGFTPAQAGSIGIIGGADGPTAIFLTARLAPELLGPIAVAAYSYMALVPVIQPPIMRLLTTKKEREIKTSQLRPVSKTEKILFPIIIAVIISLLLPSAAR